MPKPTAQDGLPLTKFGDITFPSEVTSLEFTGRHHVHEYPHTPGGNLEKLGRSLYKVSVRARFHATFPGFPDLYPNGMQTVRGYGERMDTLTFVHPSTGEFQACIIGWKQIKNARVLSGEDVEITFIEDQAQQFQLAQVIWSADETAIGPSAQRLQKELAAVQADLALSSNDESLFDALNHTVTDILAIGDTVDLYGNDFSNKIQALAGLCEQLESTFSLQDARAWPVVDALLDVWMGAQLAYQDIQSKQVQLADYVVPVEQSLLACAIDIYGDASRVTDLRGLNPNIPNNLAIPATTHIRFYDDDTVKLAA